MRTIVPTSINGSSPLARGLLVISSRFHWHMTDHPRSRGVYAVQPAGQVADRGIIPARAGFTKPNARTGTARTDHPRSRGVYLRTHLIRMQQLGSSPLARGLPAKGAARREYSGIIPARAGFTLRATRRGATRWDHPRSRGVYAVIDTLLSDQAGSSPLARGIRTENHGLTFDNRIIPARAGFTCRTARSSSQSADHPRSRGVYRRDPVFHVDA